MLKLGTLVSAKHLAENMSKFPNKVKVLDATWFLPSFGKKGFDTYKEGHIPGAQFFDIDKCSANSPYEHMLPSESQFSEYVGHLGIDNDSHVVVYNDHPKFALFSAPRVWWTFRVFGHDAVSVLDGGLRAWKDESFPVASGVETTPKKKTFKAVFNPRYVRHYEDIADNISNQKFTLVDARIPGRFNGTEPEPRPEIKPGHIPGSFNIPFTSIMGPCRTADGDVAESGIVKSPEELRKIFTEAGVKLSQPITASCGTGVTACCLVLAAYLCGKQDVCVYDGSWLEWYMRSKPEQRVNCPDT